MRDYHCVVFIILVILVWSSFLTHTHTTNMNENAPSLMPQGDNWLQSSYTPSDPININTLEDFSPSGFIGSGTQIDPYVLEGVSITTDGHCVCIVNVDAYYVIRDCLLTSQAETNATGVYLDHAPHGIIEFCVIESKHIGVKIQYSDECAMFSNTVRNNDETGFFLMNSKNCTMIDNDVCNSWSGVEARHSHNTTLIKNTVYDNNFAAIALSDSHNCTLINNTLYECYRGVLADSAFSSTFVNNDVYNNELGVVLENSNNWVLLNNSVHDNNQDGLRITLGSHMNYLNSNSVHGNQQNGIVIEDSENITVTSNEIYGNAEIGLELVNSHCCEVIANKIDKNSLSGVKLQGGSNCTISNNMLDHNTIGVHLSESADNIISDNSLQNNGFSVSTIFSSPSHFRHEFDNNSVNDRPLGYFWTEEDHVIDASSYGQIILGNCTNVTVLNGVFTNATIGVILGFCTGCEVRNHRVTNCVESGLHVIMSNNCSFLNNSVDGISSFGVILYDSSLSILSNNTMKNSGVLIVGASSGNWQHNFSNNTVAGKQLYYCWNESNNVVSGTLYGQIILVGCANMTIRDGVFSNASNGVLMGFCTDCKVLNNSFYFNDGVYLSCSTGCLFYNNTIMNTQNGMRIVNSSYCTITSNLVINGDRRGIYLCDSISCTVSNNVIENQVWMGIELYRSQKCIVTTNTIQDCIGNGFKAKDSNNGTISTNIIHNNNVGVDIDNSTGFTLFDNDIYNNQDGVWLTLSSNAFLRNNTIHGNSWSGVEARHSHNTTLIKNTVYDNNFAAIALSDSHNCTLINNTLYECYRGVLADSAFSSTFVNNDVYNNVLGIVLESSSHNCSLTNNTVIGNNNAGIWLCESDECNLTDNTICGNLKIGVDFGVSCDCIFTFNQVQGNLKTGIYIDANSNRNTFYGNSFGWNLGGNAQDHGSDNIWDDGISMGNAWGDYNGTGSVSIPGSAGSIDHFPFKADTDLPTCNEPDNFWFDVGTTDNIVIWTPYDDHPKSYLVLRNGTYFNSGAWNGSSITVSVDDLSYGTHNLTLVVYDTCYNSVSDTVLVTVTDTCAPLCNDPSDMQISEGSIGFTITWTPWDATPSSYSVLRNGTEIDSGVWDGSEIVVSLDGLSLGVYNYTLSLSDLNGNSVRNTVIITVFDATPPTIDSPIDIIYEVGVTGNVIVWHPFDLHPASYSILRNGSIVRSGGWDGSAITIAVDGLVTGSYNFTVMVIDAQGNWVVDMVFVIVIATPLTPMTVVIAVGGVGLIAFLVLVSVIKMKRKPKVVLPAIGLERAVETKVRTLRGCEIVGGKFEYKVKVQNNSYWVITNVSVVIAAYPDDCLQLVGSTMKRIPRIEPDGFRSPQFTFKPTKDCVEGQILATVTYVDHENRTNMIEVEPYVIRSVCDLLKPLESTLEEFDLILRDMTATKEQRTVDWNSEVLFKKVKVLLPAKNFEIIDMNEHTTDNIFTGTINGLAMGKYTSKRVAVKITISGIVDENKANVQIEGLGDDEAMLPTTIHEIAEGIQSWVCLNCAAPLDLIEVDQLQSRELVRCRYCNHTMSIDLYRKRST